jgi:hypothetical protein
LKIDNLRDLKKVLDLCRKAGVTDITVDGLAIHLGPLPVKASNKPKATFQDFPEARVPVPPFNGVTEPIERIETPDVLTDEQLLFYSSEGPSN